MPLIVKQILKDGKCTQWYNKLIGRPIQCHCEGFLSNNLHLHFRVANVSAFPKLLTPALISLRTSRLNYLHEANGSEVFSLAACPYESFSLISPFSLFPFGFFHRDCKSGINIWDTHLIWKQRGVFRLDLLPDVQSVDQSTVVADQPGLELQNIFLC